MLHFNKFIEENFANLKKEIDIVLVMVSLLRRDSEVIRKVTSFIGDWLTGSQIQSSIIKPKHAASRKAWCRMT